MFAEIFKFIGETLFGWLLFKERGYAKQEHPDDSIITGPEDASAQRIIDRSKDPTDCGPSK